VAFHPWRVLASRVPGPHLSPMSKHFSKHLRFALVAGALAIVMVVADELFEMGTIGFAGIFVMGMACGIWLGGQVK
jgi:hypothetical protein